VTTPQRLVALTRASIAGPAAFQVSEIDSPFGAAVAGSREVVMGIHYYS